MRKKFHHEVMQTIYKMKTWIQSSNSIYVQKMWDFYFHDSHAYFFLPQFSLNFEVLSSKTKSLKHKIYLENENYCIFKTHATIKLVYFIKRFRSNFICEVTCPKYFWNFIWIINFSSTLTVLGYMGRTLQETDQPT